MTVWHGLDAVDIDGPTAVTIGTFDGVHLGHRAVLARTVRAAHRLPADVAAAQAVAVTFDPHPLRVLAPDRAPAALTCAARRAELLRQAGADHVLVLGFDRALASWSPQEFVERVLVQALHARVVVVGADFRFGSRAAGTVATLRAEGARHGFTVDALDLVADAAGDAPWSSTLVRSLVAAGDVAVAGRALGRDHAVDGLVVEGDHRGRELGYPTANVPAPAGVAVPADGVYAGTLRRLDAPAAPVWPAAVSVGTNPTFDGVGRRVEAYVLDRDDLQLYRVEVRVGFRERLRGQVRFDDVEALVAQIASDVDRTRSLLTRR